MNFFNRVGLSGYRGLVYLNKYGQKYFGTRVRGLGIADFLVTLDYIQQVGEHDLYVDKDLAASYYLNLIGEWNEPETYQFLAFVFETYESCTFIDIGANIGEMTLQAYDHPNVKEVHVFEPFPSCMKAIKKTLLLRRHAKPVHYHQCFLSDEKRTVQFDSGIKSTRTISLMQGSKTGDIQVSVGRMDDVIAEEPVGKAIMKIDVEGAEMKVIRGARSYIFAHRPIIVFEYNQNTRRYFYLEELADDLPSDYLIFRLRPDGRLDSQYDHSRNCVAAEQSFIELCASAGICQ